MRRMSLQDYYELEWKKKCPQSMSFLASSQGLALCTNVMHNPFLPIHIFTTYCILYKTLKSMSPVKRVLLNLHICCCLLDISMRSLGTPYLYLPALSGFSVGLMSTIGIPTSVQVYIGYLLIIYMVVSMIALFESRSGSIPSNPYKMTKTYTKIAYYSIWSLACSVCQIPPFFFIPDQENARVFVLQKIPCPTEYFFHKNVFVFATDGKWGIYNLICNIIVEAYAALHVFFCIGCCLYYLFISTSHTISERTKKLQRHFFLGTVAQVTVPVTFLIVTTVAAFINVYFGSYNQELTNFFVLFYSLNAPVTDIVILLVHKPYRSFIKELINRASRSGDGTANVQLVTNNINKRTVLRKLTNSVQTML